ncbi:class I SAM-dependent methyltransferase [Nocardia iowensis]|uniref:Methyltransferase domain-containing protein n=1 Tax=Nocardia iowensis TaxID=204891 RepID=A0ABX8S0V1_NOCIO|nr:methyltransferase domain-containing protein [Nocardia iowensis]QXN94712.1 methyltransferase domain-containing protein [Nocardia iowensis]
MLAGVRIWLPFMGPFARQLGFPSGWWGRRITNGLNIFNRRVMEGSVAALKASSGETVADIGFGGGHVLAILLDQVGAHGRVYGIDISPTMIAQAQRRFEEFISTDRLRLVEAPMRKLPFGDAILDGVVTVNTIYYISDEELAASFTELARVLRPGGRLVVGAADPAFVQATPWRDGLINRPPTEVIALIEGAGFVVHEDLRIGESERAFHVYVAALVERGNN